MEKLNTKTQYNNFETGEFVDEKERSYEETIAQIEQFPWARQREKIVISLINPSITINKNAANFLKFALFYNQKYVLHYFDEKQILFTKSFFNITEAYPFIKQYFESTEFDTSTFKKEETWFQHNLQHFVTKDFNYKVTRNLINKYLLNTSGFNFLVGIVIIILIMIEDLKNFNLIILPLGIFLLFIVGGGIHLLIFYSYVRYLKNKVLKMSKGNDIFYFGNIDNPSKYDKKDILNCTILHVDNYKSQISGFAIFIIRFKDNSVLKIPNLFFSESDMKNKLYQCEIIDKQKFPFLKKIPD